MKKLLVLMLVLGMASLANAAYVLALDGTNADLTGDGTYEGFFISVYGGTASITILYNESGSEYIDRSAESGYVNGAAAALGVLSSEVTAVWYVVFMDTQMPVENQVDTDGYIVATFAGDSGTVTLHDMNTIQLLDPSQAVTLTPEPMTMMLLGLGGLFLRRRK